MYAPVSTPPSTGEVVLMYLFLGTLVLVVAVIYAFPSIVAFRRKHPSRWAIMLVNLVFGTTVLGWGVALIWAFKAFHFDDEHRGGQSGLNIFAGDVKKVEIIPSAGASAAMEANAGSASLAGEIEKLHRLLQQGVITQTEFDGMKARLIGGSPA